MSTRGLLEMRLGEWGHPAMGFVAHIPHYVANLDYPAASAAMLRARIFDLAQPPAAAGYVAQGFIGRSAAGNRGACANGAPSSGV